MPDPDIRITVDGQPALTVEMAAERKGVTAKSLSGELSRHKDRIQPVADLDGRKKLYLEDEFDAWWENRPGRGAPGVPKPARSAPARKPGRAKPATAG